MKPSYQLYLATWIHGVCIGVLVSYDMPTARGMAAFLFCHFLFVLFQGLK